MLNRYTYSQFGLKNAECGIIKKGGLFMKSNTQALRLTVLCLMAVVELIFSFTPLGTIPIGPLAVTLNIVPIAVSAVVMGPLGGGLLGAFFGFLSYLQCFGVGMPSDFGANLVKESTALTAVLCIISRMMAGAAAGIIYDLLRKKTKIHIGITGAVTGLCTALLNSIFFMSMLLLFFGDTQYLSSMIGDMNIILFIFAFVGINVFIEMAASTVITSVSAIIVKKTGLFNK